MIPLWGRPFSGSFGEAGSQPGVCRGSVSGTMMGDLRVALRTRPSGVASFGRVTHAPADSTLYRMILRGQIYISPGRRLGSMELGVSAIVPRTFLRRRRGGGIFFSKKKRWAGAWAGAGSAGGRLLVVDVPVILSDVPAVHCVRERGCAPDPVHRQSGGVFRCAPVTYSANCAEDR